jgi:hypothetical protein
MAEDRICGDNPETWPASSLVMCELEPPLNVEILPKQYIGTDQVTYGGNHV